MDYNIILCTDLYNKRLVATGCNRSLPGSLLFERLCNWQLDQSTTGAAEAARWTRPQLGPVWLPVFFLVHATRLSNTMIYPNLKIKQPMVSAWVKEEAKWREIWEQANHKVFRPRNGLNRLSIWRFLNLCHYGFQR